MSIQDPSDYKTGDAVPSNKAMDLNDNAKVFDVFQNANIPFVTSRLGKSIKTIYGNQHDIDTKIAGWEVSINSQFIYKNGGAWADAPDQITDEYKLTYWTITRSDGQEEGYAVKGSVTLPITKPSSPINDDNWFLATSVNLTQMRTESFKAAGYSYQGQWLPNIQIPAKAERADNYALWEPTSGKIIVPKNDSEFTTGATFQDDINNNLWFFPVEKTFNHFSDLLLSTINYPCTVKINKYDAGSLNVSSEWKITKLSFNDLSVQIASGYYATHSKVISGESINIAELGCVPDFNAADRTGVDNHAQIQKYLDGKAKLSASGFYGVGDVIKIRRNYASFTGTTSTKGDFRLCPLKLDIDSIIYVGGENLDEQNTTVKNTNLDSVSFSGGDNQVNGIRTGLTEKVKINNNLFADMDRGVIQAEFPNQTSIKDEITGCEFARNRVGIRGGATRVADGTVSGNIFQDNTEYHGIWGYCDGGHHFNNKVFSDPSVTTDVGFQYINPIFLHFDSTDIFGCGRGGLIVQSPRYSNFDVTIANTGLTNKEPALSVTKGIAAELGSTINAKIYDVGGSGINVSGVEDLTFGDVVIKGIGIADDLNDADAITSSSAKFSIDSLTLDGKGNNPNGAGRYWLNAVNSQVRLGQIKSLKNFSSDVFTTNSTVTRNNIVEITDENYTMSVLDNGVVCGEITASRYVNLTSSTVVVGKVMTFTNGSTGGFSLIISTQGGQKITLTDGTQVEQTNVTKGKIRQFQAVSSGFIEI